MTQSEFAILAVVPKPRLHALILGKSFEQAMGFRREMQEGLAKYSKKTAGKMDATKDGALNVIHWIESWCRDAYFRKRIPEILRQNFSMDFTKARAKTQARNEWEKLCQRASY